MANNHLKTNEFLLVVILMGVPSQRRAMMAKSSWSNWSFHRAPAWENIHAPGWSLSNCKKLHMVVLPPGTSKPICNVVLNLTWREKKSTTQVSNVQPTKPWHDMPWNPDWFRFRDLHNGLWNTAIPVKLGSIIPLKKSNHQAFSHCSNEAGRFNDKKSWMTSRQSTTLLGAYQPEETQMLYIYIWLMRSYCRSMQVNIHLFKLKPEDPHTFVGWLGQLVMRMFPWPPPQKKNYPMILLMEEIPNNHLGCIKLCK